MQKKLRAQETDPFHFSSGLSSLEGLPSPVTFPLPPPLPPLSSPALTSLPLTSSSGSSITPWGRQNSGPDKWGAQIEEEVDAASLNQDQTWPHLLGAVLGVTRMDALTPRQSDFTPESARAKRSPTHSVSLNSSPRVTDCPCVLGIP